jgi:hypothetical protein
LNIPANLNGGPDRELIFVHGHDFKPAADEFMDISVGALTGGIERDYPECLERFHALKKTLAYYGDITDALLARKGRRYDEMLDVGDRRNALVRLRSFDKKKNFGVSRYDRLPGKTALGEFAADVLGPILGRLGLSKKILETVGLDLVEYWDRKSDFAEKVRSRVREKICAALDADRHILLISHGTGCVVTYDVLWQLSHQPGFGESYQYKKIDLWLTLGAPLGDSIVKRRLLGASERGVQRFPINVVSWHNISAEDDFMSHDNTLADDYRSMLRQRQVSCIRDYRIYNLAIRYGKSNPHSSLGYLIHPRTATVIAHWLEQEVAEPLPKSIL